MLTEEAIQDRLRQVLHPELQVPIADLGLIYDIAVVPPGQVVVTMTLTSPHVPWAERLVDQVCSTVQAQPGVDTAKVRLVWDPPWSPYRLAGHLKGPLGLPDQEPSPWAGMSSWTRPLRRLLSRLSPAARRH